MYKTIHSPDIPNLYLTDLAPELRAIRRRLPKINLLVGGRASSSYLFVLASIKAQVIADLVQFGDALDTIRARSHVNGEGERKYPAAARKKYSRSSRTRGSGFGQ